MKINSKNIISCVAVCAVLVGCGGSSSSSSSTSSSSTVGVVSGSLYENAKVCFDTTGDGTCSDETVTVMSDANGSFTLTGDIYNIVAELNGSTKHEVAGDTGTAITTNQKFRIPKGLTDSDGNYIVSAISSKVYDKMLEDTSLSPTEARDAVATALGIDKDKLMENFNKSSMDSELRDKIQTEANKILAVMSDNGDLNTSSARSYVSSMRLPSRVDAISAE
jgi:acid phosphatase